jgi:hypothetical protein
MIKCIAVSINNRKDDVLHFQMIEHTCTCDFCGNESKNFLRYKNRSIDYGRTFDSFDICEKCQKKILKQLNKHFNKKTKCT